MEPNVLLLREPGVEAWSTLEASIGSKPEFLHVPIRDLRHTIADVPFQRVINQKMVDLIIKEFDPLLLDPLTVSMREDNELYLIRGQHRRAALETMFGRDHPVLCRVYYGLSEAEESKIFAMEDASRRKMRPAEKMKAGLIAGLEPFVGVDREFTRRGWRLEDGGEGKRLIRCVDAVLNIGRYNPRFVGEILDILDAAGWTEEPPRTNVVRGLGIFMSRYRGQLTTEALAKTLRKIGYANLVDKAAMRVKLDRLTTAEAVVRTIEVEYNRTHTGPRRLQP